ncbi:MAG: nucleoside hydrolase [Lachnospiraceae bacterium]|nr:nucleoside hydrolase [Lachnospiraceae bacterium]
MTGDSKTGILFDTDIGCDSDDAGALALILELMNAGECELLAVTHSTMCEAAGGCIEAILRYYGHPEIPVGTFSQKDCLQTKEWKDVYATDVAMQYDTRFKRDIEAGKTGGHYENTVKLMRKVLAKADEKVRFVVTGPLTSLKYLLLSRPDEYSELSGVELVRQKVECAVCMAGRFREQWADRKVWSDVEWNVKCDIKAGQEVCELWPSELIFCSYEIGEKIITCGTLQTEGNPNNPARTCYEIRSRKTDHGAIGRASWDAATALYAIRPESGYWNLHAYGKISVDEDGYTTFRDTADGKHTFMIEKMSDKEMETIIDGIVNRDSARNE